MVLCFFLNFFTVAWFSDLIELISQTTFSLRKAKTSTKKAKKTVPDKSTDPAKYLLTTPQEHNPDEHNNNDQNESTKSRAVSGNPESTKLPETNNNNQNQNEGTVLQSLHASQDIDTLLAGNVTKLEGGPIEDMKDEGEEQETKKPELTAL